MPPKRRVGWRGWRGLEKAAKEGCLTFDWRRLAGRLLGTENLNGNYTLALPPHAARRGRTQGGPTQCHLITELILLFLLQLSPNQEV